MSPVSHKVFSHTHYGVSTIAAVVYAIAWLVGNQVHAEMNQETTMLPAVVVTAQRATVTTTMLEPIVVIAQRVQRASYAMLPPVVVTASRDVLTASNSTSQLGTAVNANIPMNATASTTHKQGLVTKVRTWVRGWISGPRV